jgi:trans-2,3-dihydro-3-hydroxyanthranilate isomerase
MLMRYRFVLCDVFTKEAFKGNQLAVLPEAEGLSQKQMQRIAKEFNFSETSFVYQPKGKNTNKVRIFTPNEEVPFAGHPSLGAAFVLHQNGYLCNTGVPTQIVFEENAGLVEISIEEKIHNDLLLELQAPTPLVIGAEFNAKMISKVLNLPIEAINTRNHPPQVVSVGLPFLMVELDNIDYLQQLSPNMEGFLALQAKGISMIHIYFHSKDEFDIRTRMFALLEGIVEDPATGSANCALAGLLSTLDKNADGDYSWKIAQGVEMGRASELRARAAKQNGDLTGTWIGGNCVQIAEGWISL